MIGSALTPRERAQVRQALAHRLGTGLPVTRGQIITDLFGGPAAPALAGPAAPAAEPVISAPAPMAVVFLEPVTPDGQSVTPDGTPDSVVGFAEAAARLGLSVATARRYAAPSSGKLVRLGTGVSLASLVALEAGR